MKFLNLPLDFSFDLNFTFKEFTQDAEDIIANLLYIMDLFSFNFFE
jgi:hypothetical protein